MTNKTCIQCGNSLAGTRKIKLCSQRCSAKEDYSRRRPAELARRAVNRKKIVDQAKAYLLAHLLEHPCVDCGEADPIVLDFDHRDIKVKKFRLSDARRGKYPMRMVAEEVAKCDVRCANCHRRRTHLQEQSGELAALRKSGGRPALRGNP